MKKYYQAVLTIVAAVSLISLLFYRHEYNKLRYVLEVFDYFGKPNQKQISADCIKSNVSFTEHDMNLDESISSWQRLNNDLYVFSAYNLGNKEIHVIGFGRKKAVLNLQCTIFFEQETKSIIGNYKFVVITSASDFFNEEEKVDYNGYYLICTYTENKIPTGVSFLTEFDKNSINVPILPVTMQPHHLNDSGIAVCIIPPLLKPMHEIDMITFLSFHELIGINNFLAYDFGIANNFNNLLKKLAKSNISKSKFTYSTVSWNFPFSNVGIKVVKDIIEADCLHRAYNKVMYVAVLSWQEYIVLNYHNSVIKLLTDYNSLTWSGDRYKLNTLTFCIKELNNIRSTNATLIMYRKTQFDRYTRGNYPIFISKPYEVLSQSNVYTPRMAQDIILVHRYKICNDIKETKEVITSNIFIPKFSEDIRNSQIFTKFTAISSH